MHCLTLVTCYLWEISRWHLTANFVMVWTSLKTTPKIADKKTTLQSLVNPQRLKTSFLWTRGVFTCSVLIKHRVISVSSTSQGPAQQVPFTTTTEFMAVHRVILRCLDEQVHSRLLKDETNILPPNQMKVTYWFVAFSRFNIFPCLNCLCYRPQDTEAENLTNVIILEQYLSKAELFY